MSDGPVSIVRQAVDRLDRHHRTFERAHPVKCQREDHHPDDRIGADLVPRAVERHQPVDHPAPAGHPQHDRKDHAQRLRPVGQRGIVQMVRARPDVEKDQAPEMDDRKPVGIDRTPGLLGHEVVHHRQEPGGQEEADRIVAVPPLHQRALHPGPQRIALRTEEADRHVGVIDQVQQRYGENEAEIEPVRDVDMGFGALHDRGNEDDQVGNPDNCEPQIDVPFRLGIFLALGDPEQIAGRGEHDEQLIAPEHETGEAGEGQPRPASTLDDIERRRDQRVASEGENHGRRVQRPQASEGRIFNAQVEHRERQLQGDVEPGQKSREPPEYRGDDPPADRIVIVPALICRDLEQAPDSRLIVWRAERIDQPDQGRQAEDRHVHGKAAVGRRSVGNDCK